MKQLKALIKIERQPAIIMGIYFMLINIAAIIAMAGCVNRTWRNYLYSGIENFNDWTIGDFIYPITLMVFMGYGLGLLVLTYLQFRKDKSIEISRFIKALPFTNGERGMVKIMMGLLSFTIPFFIYMVMVLMLRSHAVELYSEIYRVTAFEEVAAFLNRPSVYLSFICITYVKMLMIYFILIMCQHLISHNVGSILVAVCSIAAPAYIWISSAIDFDYADNKITEYLYKIYITYTQWGNIEITGSNYRNGISYTITEGGGSICLVYLAVILMCSLVIIKQVKKQHIENADIFMPGRVTRMIFIAGVAVCIACLVRDISRIVLTQIALGYPRVVLYLFLVIGFAAGIVIAMKIAHIGLNVNKEVA